MPWIEIWTNNGTKHVELDTYPKTCPYCGLLISAEYSNSATFFYRSSTLNSTRHTYLEVVFQCPSQDCERLFIGLYEMMEHPTHSLFSFSKTIPDTSHMRNFDPLVKEISPSFCEIWNQAFQAEQSGLIQICGMGYRKAVEFLIKDYLMQQNPQEQGNIKSSLLGPCITKYIKDDLRISACATRAVWLGNDETHYLRKWEGTNVNDLKNLIDLTLHWIQMRHLTKQYENEIPDRPSAT